MLILNISAMASMKIQCQENQITRIDLDYYTILFLSHQAAWADPLSVGDVWQGRVKTV